jgi:probable addiction module antidote protein
MKLSITHDELMQRVKKADPVFAAYMLDEALREGNQAEVLLTIRRIADDFGGVGIIADATKLNRESIYKMLSAKGNPLFSSINEVLKTVGIRLAAVPINQPPAVAQG